MADLPTMTLDEICRELGVIKQRRTKILQRIKKKYGHGIMRLIEHGRAGRLKKAELVLKKNVAQEFIRVTAQKMNKNRRLEQVHGWLYLIQLKSLVRKANGSYNVWVKLGETIEFARRIKKYKGTEAVGKVLCVLPVHDRIASENNAIDYMVRRQFPRGKREYFQVPEESVTEIVVGFFLNHLIFTKQSAIQSGGTI